MGANYYQDGFIAGSRGQDAIRPPYDPRDPRGMLSINLYTQGFQGGVAAQRPKIFRDLNQLRPLHDNKLLKPLDPTTLFRKKPTQPF